MLVHLYDKDTFLYQGSREARLDQLETIKQGKEVYAKPRYATFAELPECKEGQTPIYNLAEDSWGVCTSYIGCYLVNTKSGRISKITNNRPIRSFEFVITEDEYNKLLKEPDRYRLENKKLKDISGTQEYQNKININKYKELMNEAKKKYDVFMETPIKFNGQYYLPRYVDDYCKLALRTFPLEIWDAEGMNSKVMSLAEFNKLKKFLEDKVNKAYKEKKEALKKYKKAIKELGGE